MFCQEFIVISGVKCVAATSCNCQADWERKQRKIHYRLILYKKERQLDRKKIVELRPLALIANS